jgi:hypothetical protein
MVGLGAGLKLAQRGYKRYGLKGVLAAGGIALVGYVIVKRALDAATGPQDDPEDVEQAIDEEEVESEVEDRGVEAVAEKETLESAVDDDQLDSSVDFDEVKSKAKDLLGNVGQNPDSSSD